jgi:HSP20 family protein
MIEAHANVNATHGAGHSSNLDDMFEMFFGGGRPSKAISMQGDLGWRPATDVYETESEFVIQMDLAGMKREEIEVLVDESFVIVKGTRGNIAPAGKKHFHKMEILVGPFERHIRIPDEIDGTSAKARYHAGFLFVTLRRGSGRCAERRSVAIVAERG